jgi:hypothetical protein
MLRYSRRDFMLNHSAILDTRTDNRDRCVSPVVVDTMLICYPPFSCKHYEMKLHTYAPTYTYTYPGMQVLFIQLYYIYLIKQTTARSPTTNLPPNAPFNPRAPLPTTALQPAAALRSSNHFISTGSNRPFPTGADLVKYTSGV